MDRVFPHTCRMSRKVAPKDEESTASSTAKVLGVNLQALMSAHPELGSNPKLAKKTDLGTGSISRLRNGEVDATLSTLQKIAKAFDLQAWQLLVPGLDPKHVPTLRHHTEQERKLYERIERLAREMKEEA